MNLILTFMKKILVEQQAVFKTIIFFFLFCFQDDQTVLAEDLRLCKVRLAEETVERRFIFEVVSPTK